MAEEKSPREKSPLLRSTAAGLLLVALAAAPWLIGAKTTLPALGWIFGGAMMLGFLLLGLSGRWGRAGGPWLWGPVVFLLGLTGWWALAEAPRFATAFAAEHWAFLRHRFPHAFFLWERGEQLWFYAGLGCALVSAAILGRRRNFRQGAAWAMGGAAIVFALYALGNRWLGWSTPPWVLIEGGTERFNVSFTHYSGPAACLNLGWPLVFFSLLRGTTAGTWVLRLVLAGLIGAALATWNSAAGQAVGIGIFVVGLAWAHTPLRERLSGKTVAAILAAALLAVWTWQAASVWKLRGRDGWLSAEATRLEADGRDAGFRTQADRRGDRLVISPAADRPSGWTAGARMAADHLLVGRGPGSWTADSALYSNDSFVNTFFLYRLFVHHDLLQFAAEWGGLAALAMLLIWGGAWWRALQRKPEEPAGEAGIVLALVGVVLHSAVDFPLQNPAIQLWAAVLLGLAWSRRER